MLEQDVTHWEQNLEKARENSIRVEAELTATIERSQREL